MLRVVISNIANAGLQAPSARRRARDWLLRPVACHSWRPARWRAGAGRLRLSRRRGRAAAVGAHLGSLAGRTSPPGALRCGWTRGQPQSRAARKRAVTAQSRPGGPGRSPDQRGTRSARRENLRAERQAAGPHPPIEARLAGPAGGRRAGDRGMPPRQTARQGRRLQSLKARLAGVEGSWRRGPCPWSGAGRRCCASGQPRPRGPDSRPIDGTPAVLIRPTGRRTRRWGNETIAGTPGRVAGDQAPRPVAISRPAHAVTGIRSRCVPVPRR